MAVFLCAPNKKTKRPRDLLLGGKGFKHVWKAISIMQSQNKNPPDFGFSKVHSLSTLSLKLGCREYKNDFSWRVASRTAIFTGY
jgi:hypothetical protein